MMKREVVIVGAGVVGLCVARELLTHGFRVSVYEKLAYDEHARATSFAAGGMLAPFSEMETAEPLIMDLGSQSLQLWPDILKQLESPIFFRQAGSLIVCHPRDQPYFDQLTQRIIRQAAPDEWRWVRAAEIEPELETAFDQCLWLPNEAQLDNRQLLPALVRFIDQHTEGEVHFGHDLKEIQSQSFRTNGRVFTCDRLIDCRGFDAAEDIPTLRAVRGEAVLVHAPQVGLQRPIRLMHPRYALYIVPRGSQHFYLGASQIESASCSPVTVRSLLELLSAAYSVHRGFGEATVLELLQGLRPALPDHRPKIFVEPGLLRINGLYRHGYLLAPAIARHLRLFLQDSSERHYSQLFHFL